jgi:WD40 repeat protein
VATASIDQTARLWDVKSGQELHKLPHVGPVNSVAFSPDGQTVATASSNTARIWDVRSGQELCRLPHDGLVNSVAFSPDGKTVATASGDDKAARIWLVSSQELMKIACNRITENLTIQDWKLYGLDESKCKTCPREGRFNQMGQGECQPCIGNNKVSSTAA